MGRIRLKNRRGCVSGSSERPDSCRRNPLRKNDNSLKKIGMEQKEECCIVSRVEKIKLTSFEH